MLSAFRDNLKSLKWVLWVVALAMVGYLGSYFVQTDATDSGQWAAKVNGEEISIRTFQLEAKNLDDQYRAQFGEVYEQLKASLPPLGTAAVERLIQQELKIADARRLGIVASKREQAELVYSLPGFQDAGGNFIGEERFNGMIRSSYGSTQAFWDIVEKQILLNKWDNIVSEAVAVPESELKQLYRDRFERTTIDYFVVPSSEQDTPNAPDETQLRAWYDDHSSDYRRETGRKIRWVKVDRSSVSSGIEITEQEIEASYDAERTNYERPEQRRASHVLIRVEPGADSATRDAARAEAEGLLDQALGGANFAALAEEHSDDTTSARRGGDLNYFDRARMVPQFADAVWATRVGDFAPLTETDFGFHIIKVTGERAAGLLPLDDALKAQIRSKLELDRAGDLLTEQALAISDELAAVGDLSEMTDQPGRTKGESFVVLGERVVELGTGPAFSSAVFAAPIGGSGEPQDVPGGMVAFHVVEEIDASVAPFEEVTDQVRSDWTAEQLRIAAVSSAESALNQANSLERAAKRLDKEVSNSGALGRQQTIPNTGGTNAEVMAALFSDAALTGNQGVVAVPAGALVYEIQERTGYDESGFFERRAELEAQLLGQREAELQQEMLNQLREKADVLVNSTVVDQLNASTAAAPPAAG